MTKAFATFAFALLLTGCSSLGGIAPSGAGSAGVTADQMAGATFAVDLPASVESIEGPRVAYGATLNATLVRADAEAVMATLPPPADGRSYAVYAFSPADQQKVRALAAGGAPNPLSILPRVCLTPDAKKDRDTVAVHAVLPGRGTMLLVPFETLAALETRSGAPLPACEGHSG